MKHVLYSIASLSRTLHIASRLDRPSHLQTFVRADRTLVAGAAVRSARIVPQVGLRSDEDDRRPRAEVADLWNPLERHVGEAVAVVDGKADDDHVGVGVRQRTQLFVVLLTGRIP